ncbi:MAG TPA: hypothetical protein DDZ91_06430 [Firmicutes bacterium]|nr:hypothetical protein [Bacillota bacterium]
MQTFNRKEMRKLFSSEKWKQGRAYWQTGLVLDPVQGSTSLQATVSGLTGAHRVRIRRNGNSITMDCSCAEAGSPCQHAAAVLWGWFLAPGEFLKVEQLLLKIKALSKEEAVELIGQVAKEEGALLQRLLKKEQATQQLTGNGLLCLVSNLGFNYGSPWVNWRLFEASYRSALKLIVRTTQERNTGGWEALFGLIKRTKDLLTIAPEAKNLLLPLFFEATDLFLLPTFPGLRGEMLNEFMAVYLQTPLEKVEEELFHQIIFKLWVKELVEKEKLCSLLSSSDDPLKLCALKKFRLRGLISIRYGKKEDLEELIDECKSHLMRLLWLLDLLEENSQNEEAKTLIKWGLSIFLTIEDRYILRYRLAQIYRKAGELRPALFLELLNFKERPGKAEYLSLKQLAMAVGEWDALKERVDGYLKFRKFVNSSDYG